MFHFQDENIKILKNTLLTTHFCGINYYIPNMNHSDEILYYSEEENVNDPDTSFLFINQLPVGNYTHFLYLETSLDTKTALVKIQDCLLTASLDVPSAESLPESLSHFFLNGIPDSQSLGEIIKMTSHLVNNPVMLSTTAYEIIELCDNNIAFTNPIWDETAKTGICSPELVEQFESSGITEKVLNEPEPVLWSLNADDDCPKLTSKILYNKEVIAYLSIFLINKDSLDESFSILKELEPVLLAILSTSPHYISDHCRLTRDFVYRLLEDEQTVVPSEIADLIRPLSDYRLVCVANKQCGTIYNYNYYLNILLKEGIIGTFYKGKLILLIKNHSDMKMYMKKLQDKYFSRQYYLFVSESLCLLSETSKVAPAMLHFSNYAFENQSIIFTNDYLQILYVPAHALYHAAYHRLENSANKDLKETLIQYIEHNLNVSETADALFIHRNTLFYRLQRITSDYGINTSSYLDLTNFYLYHLSIQKKDFRQP